MNNFPMVNQLHEQTADGYPDENAQNNCVPACIAACLEYFLGGAWDGDEIKDAVYGQGYTGPMAIGEFAGYCHDRGVALTPVTGDSASLIAAVHAGIAAGDPVVCTIPSQWGVEPPPTSGSTHVTVAYGQWPGVITSMNPWGGFVQQQPDSWWEPRLRFNTVWRVSKMSQIPTGWKDDGTTLTAPNGIPVTEGFRAWVLNNPWDGNNWPLVPVYSSGSIEPGNASIGPGTRQDFRLGSLGWTAKMNVYTIWIGQDFRALLDKLNAAYAEIDQLKSAPPPPPPPPASDPDTALGAAIRTALVASGFTHA